METLAQFAERIDPRKFNFSNKRTALVGAIIGHDHGVRDRKGGRARAIAHVAPPDQRLAQAAALGKIE